MVLRSAPSRIAVTVAMPALGLLACQLLRPWLDPTFDPVFMGATAITAWVCGARYAFVCVLLSALILDYFFLAPYNSLELLDAGLRTKFFLFLGLNSIIIGLIEIIRNARNKLAESEQRYRSLAELIPFGAWRADRRGNMIQLSESFLKTFGTTMEECRGLGWVRLLEEPDATQVVADWRECMRSGYFWDYEYRLRSPSGERYVILSRGIPVYNPNTREKSWVGMHLDVTERERSAEERVEQARDIARFNAELEQLAYVSAHDLQEPLRMIASYVQLLARRYKGKLDADADLFIGYAVEGTARLKSLLEDLLELQQVGKGLRPRSVAPLAHAVDRACKKLANRIAETGAKVTCDELPVLRYEERSLEKLFFHLIDNAIKYRREGIPPDVHISATRDAKRGVWEIRVADNGVGIPEPFQRKVFDVFQRLHPRDFPGTGIGLAICKKIVEVHGGQISVESTPGEGSTFVFTLPVVLERA